MKETIEELWHGNIIPQEDSRTNSKEMKELLGYIARHHEDLEKSFTDEQKEIFEKFHDCWGEYASLAEEAIFAYAFKLGANLMLETLSEQRKNCIAEDKEKGDSQRRAALLYIVILKSVFVSVIASLKKSINKSITPPAA